MLISSDEVGSRCEVVAVAAVILFGVVAGDAAALAGVDEGIPESVAGGQSAGCLLDLWTGIDGGGCNS